MNKAFNKYKFLISSVLLIEALERNFDLFPFKNLKSKHIKSELNFISRLILGVSAKKFKKEHSIKNNDFAERSMSSLEIKAFEHLQSNCIAMLDMEYSKLDRRANLVDLFENLYETNLVNAYKAI